MYKTFILTVFTTILFAAAATAQEHTWMIFGGGGYDKVNYTENATIYNGPNGSDPLPLIGWAVNLGIGCQFSKHFMAGALGGYGRQDGADSYAPYYNSATIKFTDKFWQAGVFGRYTSWLSKRFFFYTQLNAFKYAESWTQEQLSATTVQPYTYSYPATPDGNGFTVSLFPAIGATVWKGFGVNMDIGGIGYSVYHSFSAATRHHFNVTLGQQFSFGIHKIIGWQKLNTKPEEGTAK